MIPNVRKTIFRTLIGLSAFLLFSLATIVVAVVFYRPKPTVPDTSDWQTGMVFFSVGDSWESAAVRVLTGAKYFEIADSTPSHCGVILRDANKVSLVHESTIAKRIVAETPEEYFENNGSYCLFAVRPTPAPDSIAIRRTLDSLLVQRIPFDFDFNHADSQSLYCTEMVIKVFELNGNFSFSALRHQKYIYPEDLLKICRNQ